ncbi:hypothetical protein QUA35_23625 [Microcoleus sp. N9_B2]|uniref:hypothetical protein n=1 Tax=unclassified Microcoleus TaxID=2642155 RepID=UPI002FD073F3
MKAERQVAGRSRFPSLDQGDRRRSPCISHSPQFILYADENAGPKLRKWEMALPFF